MTDPKFRNADGTLTAYALACGYADTVAADGSPDYYGTDADAVRLSFNGCTYDVHVRQQGVTHDGDYPRWVSTAYGRTRADWHQFDTLAEARRAWRTFARAIRTGASITVAA